MPSREEEKKARREERIAAEEAAAKKDRNQNDHGNQMTADEFLGEVIKIGKVGVFQIAINHEETEDENHVTCMLIIDIASPLGGYYEKDFVARARTVGLAMREVREALREVSGK